MESRRTLETARIGRDGRSTKERRGDEAQIRGADKAEQLLREKQRGIPVQKSQTNRRKGIREGRQEGKNVK